MDFIDYLRLPETRKEFLDSFEKAELDTLFSNENETLDFSLNKESTKIFDDFIEKWAYMLGNDKLVINSKMKYIVYYGLFHSLAERIKKDSQGT